MTESFEHSKQRVWQIVHAIPPGQVATYGQIARLAGINARLAGRILGKLPSGSQLPWHRVVNGQGKITSPGSKTQIERLAEEGIAQVNGKISLRQYGWEM